MKKILDSIKDFVAANPLFLLACVIAISVLVSCSGTKVSSPITGEKRSTEELRQEELKNRRQRELLILGLQSQATEKLAAAKVEVEKLQAQAQSIAKEGEQLDAEFDEAFQIISDKEERNRTIFSTALGSISTYVPPGTPGSNVLLALSALANVASVTDNIRNRRSSSKQKKTA
uniref:Uncharacterized protein n=1 Tax=viral metagenome TaxID=1070528 RepID=A0A2V0R9G6_9ZZZZ